MGTKVEDLAAAITLLIDAAKPTDAELAKAITSAMDTQRKYALANAIDAECGYVTLAGLDTAYVLETLETQDETCTLTHEQLYVALLSVSSSFDGVDTSEFYDELIEELRKDGAIVPKEAA